MVTHLSDVRELVLIYADAEMPARQREALEAVRDYLMEEWHGPLAQIIGDGEDIVAWEDADFGELTRVIETTDDDVTSNGASGCDRNGLVALYRQVIDALAPDGGAARRAGHLLHWADDLGRCTKPGCDWRAAGSECLEFGHEWGPPIVGFGYVIELGYPWRGCENCPAIDEWDFDELWPVGGEVLL